MTKAKARLLAKQLKPTNGALVRAMSVLENEDDAVLIIVREALLDAAKATKRSIDALDKWEGA